MAYSGGDSDPGCGCGSQLRRPAEERQRFHRYLADEHFGDVFLWSKLAYLAGDVFTRSRRKPCLYLEGGAAWVQDRFDVTQSGGTIGGGVEYSLLPNWLLFVEYAYYEFGSFNAALGYSGADAGVGTYTYNENQTMQGQLPPTHFASVTSR